MFFTDLFRLTAPRHNFQPRFTVVHFLITSLLLYRFPSSFARFQKDEMRTSALVAARPIDSSILVLCDSDAWERR